MERKTKRIKLSKGKWAIVSPIDYLILKRYKWSATNCRQDGKDKWYAVRRPTINGKRVTIYMHRFITECPANRVVDHLNGDGLNNTRNNLEIVTIKENQRRWRLKI